MKKNTVRVDWQKGKYRTKQVFNNQAEAENFIAKNNIDPLRVGETSWSEHRYFKQLQKELSQ